MIAAAYPSLTAAHEAGHVVTGHALGLPVLAVRLEAGGGGTSSFDGHAFDAAHPADLLTIAVAGAVAVEVLIGARVDWTDGAFARDAALAIASAESLDGRDAGAWHRWPIVRRARAAAAAILTAHEHQANALALALDERGELTGADVLDIIDPQAAERRRDAEAEAIVASLRASRAVAEARRVREATAAASRAAAQAEAKRRADAAFDAALHIQAMIHCGVSAFDPATNRYRAMAKLPWLG